MGFNKGNNWNGNKFGRPKGSRNRSSEMQKINVQRAINEGLDFLKEDYQKIREEDPAKAVTLLLKMMEYSIPKLKSVDMNVEGQINSKIEQITININRSGSNEH